MTFSTAAPAAAYVPCANCRTLGHYPAYHDGIRRPQPWRGPSHCRAWDPESPNGVCQCTGYEAKPQRPA